jgi:hypothetical protein
MDELWNTFTQTGRVEDYLRYRGLNVVTASREQEVPRETDDRRTHHPRT